MAACSEMLKSTMKLGSQKKNKFLDALGIAAESCSELRMSGGNETCCPRIVIKLNLHTFDFSRKDVFRGLVKALQSLVGSFCKGSEQGNSPDQQASTKCTELHK